MNKNERSLSEIAHGRLFVWKEKKAPFSQEVRVSLKKEKSFDEGQDHIYTY